MSKKVWKNEKLVCYQDGKLQYLQFKILLQYPEIVHAYTLRSGNELNFPPIIKDEKTLKESYHKICECLNLDERKVVKPYQTHTDIVKTVNIVEEFEEIDGLITDKKDLVLLTTSADCTSMLFYDTNKKIVGSVHSGWKGTLKGIAKNAVQKMIEEYNSNPQDIICCICPHIRECCFEVDEDVKELFKNKYQSEMEISEIIKQGEIKEGKQKYYIDTTKINKMLLKKEGLKAENIVDSDICTVCNSEYFHSYRVDKENSGRNAALISIKL